MPQNIYMKNLTFHNLMAVIRTIEAKGWTFEKAERTARTIFQEFAARPEGLSIEERVRRVLMRAEWKA